jgi:hypothetical protein
MMLDFVRVVFFCFLDIFALEHMIGIGPFRNQLICLEGQATKPQTQHSYRLYKCKMPPDAMQTASNLDTSSPSTPRHKIIDGIYIFLASDFRKSRRFTAAEIGQDDRCGKTTPSRSAPQIKLPCFMVRDQTGDLLAAYKRGKR